MKVHYFTNEHGMIFAVVKQGRYYEIGVNTDRKTALRDRYIYSFTKGAKTPREALKRWKEY